MKIVEKKILSEAPGARVSQIKVAAPRIAKSAKAGQFVVLMVTREGERIPLTIVAKDAETITLIFQETGLTTKLLGKMDSGDFLYTLVGPLGTPTDIENFGRVIVVGGGVGIAEIYPVSKALKSSGNNITSILGARSKGLLILEKELSGISDEIHITTDDGTYGRKGFVTDVLKDILAKSMPHNPYHLVYTVGPIPMMRRVADVTKPFNVKTLVSLNALMVDATGMCGCCRVSVGGETKFSCVDGPEFDAHKVDWDELTKRNKIYEEKEKHACNLYKVATI